MHIKRYTLASILLIATVGGYIYYMVTQSSYTIELMGVNVTLPIAIWVVLAMTLLYIASLFHMLYYGIKSYFQKRRTERDLAKLSDALYWDILKSPKKHIYDDKEIKKIGELLDSGLEDFSKVDKSFCDDKVKEAIEIVEAIKRGDYVDIKKVDLDKSNPLVVKNWLNFLHKEPHRAEEILKRPQDFDEKVVKEALKIFVENSSSQQIEKYKNMLDIDAIIHMLESIKVEDSKEPRIALSFIDTLLDGIQIGEDEYLEIAKRLSKLYKPDEVLRFFEKRVASDDSAFKAYIYVLIEFEMLDKAYELLQDTSHGEYLEYKAFLDLRRAGKHYPMELLIPRC